MAKRLDLPRPGKLSGSRFLSAIALAAGLTGCSANTPAVPSTPYAVAPPDTVEFRSGDLKLRGVIWKPMGRGPFPAVIYSHGSGQSYDTELAAVGPFFARNGYLLFWPFRRGQGLSAGSGEAIVTTLDRVAASEGREARGRRLAELLWTEQVSDQLAALNWLVLRRDVDSTRIAAAGNSFGGIVAVFMGARAPTIKAVVASAAAAQTWATAAPVRDRMIAAAHLARVPIFFFQAENDYDLSPSKVLSAEMTAAGKPNQVKIYPSFGATTAEGHSFGYYGSATWGLDVLSFLSMSFASTGGVQQ